MLNRAYIADRQTVSQSGDKNDRQSAHETYNAPHPTAHKGYSKVGVHPTQKARKSDGRSGNQHPPCEL